MMQHYKNSSKESDSVDKTSELSLPAMKTSAFYAEYINCWNINVGHKPQKEWNDCDALITTNYFTKELIDKMSGRTKAYCGYEQPTGIYVTEKNHEVVGKNKDVFLWGKGIINSKPIKITLAQNEQGKWQIENIVCPSY